MRMSRANRRNNKVSIIGAGNVGTRYAYALMMSGITREIVLVDINRDKLIANVMDLTHGIPYTSNIDIQAGNYKDIENSDLVVITVGGMKQIKKSRLESVDVNTKLFKKIIPEIQKYAPDAIYLVVSNPVDILSYVAYKISNKPSSEILGSGTTLDTARFRYLLGRHCEINPINVHAYILGEHGDTEFPVWSRAMFGGNMIKEYCDGCFKRASCEPTDELNEIFDGVKNSAYEIIEKKGETSYGIGLSLVRITRAILNDENSILPVSVLVDGFLGVQDVYLSLPAILNRNGVREIMKIDLNEKEQKLFQESAETLKNVIKDLDM
jgi:L-lactate dehydrogenase